MSALDNLISIVHDRFHSISTNFSSSISRLSITDYIRLIAIVGAYALLRPYLLRLGARFQRQDHEREIDPLEVEASTQKSPESLRGKVHVPEDSDSESETEGKRGTDWGKKARRRQRRVIRTLLEQEEQRRKEDDEVESDKEIEEFLVE